MASRSRKSVDDNLDQRAVDFWQWFASTAPRLDAFDPADELIEELDHRVALLGRFGWEIGPGIHAPAMLAISPGGNKSRLAAVRRIIEHAPLVGGWEFHAGKPPKEWQAVFDMHTNDNELVRIDASNWQYVMLRYPDGATEVLVETPGLEGLSEQQRRWATEIVLDGMLGEVLRIEAIDLVEPCLRLDVEYAALAKPITAIRVAFGLGAP